MRPYEGWRPQIKPGPPHAIERDPHGILANGLQSALLFESPILPSGMRDHARPSQKFTANGTSAAQSSSPYGGLAFSTTDNASNDSLVYSQSLPSTNVWTFACRVKFNGASSAGGGSHVFVANSAFSLAIGIDGTTGDIQAASTSPRWTNKSITAFTGWTVVGLSTNGVNGRLFFNGAFDSTQALNMAIDLTTVGWAFPYAMDYFFWWTRSLADSEMATHFADPFGTTLRPRFGAIRRVPARHNISQGQMAPILAQ